MPDYYDYVLVLVPVAFVGFSAGFVAGGVDHLLAMGLGAAAGCLVVGHALFVNGPAVAADEGRTAAGPAQSRASTSTPPPGSASVHDAAPPGAD
jgi:hypothetical protein